MKRRQLLRMGGTAGALVLSREFPQSTAFEDLGGRTTEDVDHIMWGACDLDEGIAFIEAKTGVRAVFGGVHPGRGTRNALVSLGTHHYLEIIALDPAQKGARDLRVTQLQQLTAPRVLTWAAGTRDIDALDRKLRTAGFGTSGVIPGSRAKPDGTILKWRALAVNSQDDLVPFVIEWDPASKHPSADSPAGCTIKELWLEHPDPGSVNRFLEAMGLRTRASRGLRAGIGALLIRTLGRRARGGTAAGSGGRQALRQLEIPILTIPGHLFSVLLKSHTKNLAPATSANRKYGPVSAPCKRGFALGTPGFLQYTSTAVQTIERPGSRVLREPQYIVRLRKRAFWVTI